MIECVKEQSSKRIVKNRMLKKYKQPMLIQHNSIKNPIKCI